jgi:integrase/recombinase XerD
MTDLINRNISQGFSLSTIQSYKLYLHQFLAYLTAERIKQLYLINISHIIGFIKSCGNDKLASRHCKLAIIRRFFKFAYDQKLLPIDYSAKIPMSNYTRQSKLPSVYFPQEISALINVIDRGNPKGKRDYAMVLLATRLGLRSSDILGLRFDNIIWEDCRISLNQQKTNTPIDFPLSEEIGSAIIDYLKYARPVSDKPIIFLTLVAPFKELSAPGFANIVQSSLKLAGIDYSKRKRGPHILRHSLASELLKDKIPLPIISEVLGHKNTNSTMYYLRIDIDSLRKCALEVPSISPMFYTRVQNYLSSNK